MQNTQKYIDFHFIVCYNKFIEASNILVLRSIRHTHRRGCSTSGCYPFLMNLSK